MVSSTAAVDSRAGRGREAHRPQEIPARGWWDITLRVVKRIGSDNVTLVAGGVAMYALLSVFPGLTAAVSIYGLFASPGDVLKHMSVFSGVLPSDVLDVFNAQLQSLVSHAQSTLSLAAVFGVILALWSARSAMSALMTATNIAYGEHEKRNYLVQTLVSLGFTVGAILGFLTLLLLGVALPVTLKILGTQEAVQWLLDGLQWLLLWVFAIVGFSILYRYAPARQPARWRWVTPGSAIAATLWLASSALFAIYVRSFAHYGKSYGALGGVVAMLMWFYLSGLLVVLGAQINAEIERQTEEDTTEGPAAPMGQRGAYAADTLGPTAHEPDRGKRSDIRKS